MSLRELRDDDYEALAGVFNTCTSHWPTTGEALRAEYREAAGSHPFIRVSEDADGRAVGIGHLASPPELGDPRKMNLRVLVHADHRREGRGGELAAALMAEADRRGWAELTAHFLDEGDTAGARRLLERWGFAEVLRGDLFAVELAAFDEAEAARALAATPVAGLRVATLAEETAPDRVERWHELFRAAYRDVPEMVDLEPPDRDRFRRRFLEAPGMREDSVWLAEADGRYVGYTQFRYPPGGGDPFIVLTVVRREYRRRGLARLLKLQAQAAAKRRGDRRIITGTAMGNEGMQKLNRALGFKPFSAYVYCRRVREGN
ncbi:MAG: GNAT family N-acetyltransferase [Candidatus Krumholzibacteriota bacterium]|nr:GNAT family N-acetyltransferase [Candidatus Krumholzibacteriota bacterium]